MKSRLLLVAALIAASGPAYPQGAGIPVTNPGVDFLTVAQYLKEAKQWVKENEAAFKRFQELQSIHKSMNGKRTFGEFMYDPKLNSYMPAEWVTVFQTMQGYGEAGISERAKKIRKASKIFDTCASMKIEDERLSCEARAVKPSQDQADALEATEKAEERAKQIEALQQAISKTEDPKEIAELQANLAAVHLAIANDAAKLDLYKMASNAETMKAEQRQSELEARTWSSKKTTDVEPLTYGAGG